MKTPLLSLIPALVVAAQPNPVTETWYIANVESERCVAAIRESVMKVRSVTAVKMRPSDGYAHVSYDTHAASQHQIAQAVASAEPQHGKRYVPTIRRAVPQYAEGGNAAKVDAAIAKYSEGVKFVLRNRETGEFEIQFEPLVLDPAKEGMQGWSGQKIGHALADPPPKGLGLRWRVVREGNP